MAGDVDISMFTILFKVSVVILYLILSVCCSQETAPSLYSDKDDVFILNYQNFKENVLGSDSAWLVEFYSSWCGHCVRFAPTWKELATDVKDWSPVIKVGAINCAAQENFDICKEFDIQAYPTLKFFQAYAIEGVDKGEKLKGSRDLANMRHAMIQFVERQSAGSRPKSWPKLHILQSMADIWKDVHHAIQYTAVVFEDTNSDLGMQVILDMSKYRKLLVRRMLKDDVKKFGVTTVPSLFLINQDGTFTKLADKGDRAEFVRALKMLIGVEVRPIESKTGTIQPVVADDGTKQLRYPDGVHMQDLESAVHYTLRMEVPRMSSIEGAALQALKDLARVLAKYWPGKIVIHQFLNRLSDWLQAQKGPISGEDLLQTVNDMQTSQAYLPTTLKWTECAGSTPQYRGYPCSMWMLFHTLLVNAVLQQEEEAEFDPLEIPRAMRSYIVNFFGCRECAQNFQKEAATLENEISSADEAVVWLWAIHNRVNKRLQSDITTDPEHPKIQFPAAGMCQACSTTRRGKLVFDEDEVLRFLKKFYGKDNIIDDAEPYQFSPRSVPSTRSPLRKYTQKRSSDFNNRKRNSFETFTDRPAGMEKFKPKFDEERIARLRKEEEETRLLTEELRSSSGLTRIDLSMCVAFYIMCTAIIILIYYHFTVNRRMTMGFKLLSKA